MEQQEILGRIKAAVLEVVPDAKVYLFGSRARGDWHKESDWDILVLTKQVQPMETRWKLRQLVSPLETETCSFFQFVMATEDEWENAPHLYALHKLANPELVSL